MEEKDNDDKIASLDDPLLPVIDASPITSSVEAQQESRLSLSQEEVEEDELKGGAPESDHSPMFEHALGHGLKILFTTCLKHSPEYPHGRTNVHQTQEMREELSAFHEEVTSSSVKNLKPNERTGGTEFSGINTMCRTQLVLNDPDFKHLHLIDYFQYLYEKNYRHFPNPTDVYVDMNGQVHPLHHTYKKNIVNEYDEAIGEQVEVTQWLDVPLEGERTQKPKSGEVRKRYPRGSWTVKQYQRENGKLQVVTTYRMQIRIHVVEKFNMIDRAMKLGVPDGYVLDPMEKMWYLHIKGAEMFTGKKETTEGMKVPIGSGVARLECSHIDHGVRGLDFIRIESKGMNMCRVVSCFSNIACSRCNWLLDAKCRHTPKCTKTFWIVCSKCSYS